MGCYSDGVVQWCYSDVVVQWCYSDGVVQWCYSFADTECNSNGEHLLNICAEQDLIITNSLFKHRRSQIKTWYRCHDINQSSQIDFILTRRTHRREVTDARSIPNAIIDTDHRPVILWQRKFKFKHQTNRERRKVINTKQLNDLDTQNKISREFHEAYKQIGKEVNIEKEWLQFKELLLNIVENNC
jgi:hypothetical protein